MDKKGEILIKRHSVINAIEEAQADFDHHYIWRIKTPNILSYTWSRSKPFIQGVLKVYVILRHSIS